MTIFFSPPLYFTVRTWPSTLVTDVSTVALVIVVPGRSHGRCPSPRPRIDSGKILTRMACWLSSAWGVAPTPMNVPGLTSASVAFTNANTGADGAMVTAFSACDVLTTSVATVDPLDGADDARGLLDLSRDGRYGNCDGNAEGHQGGGTLSCAWNLLW